MMFGRTRAVAVFVSAALGFSFLAALGAPAVAAPVSTAATTAAASPAGTLAPAGAGSYVAVTPARILDTRYGTGVPAAAVPARGTVAFPVLGRGGVLSSGVGAVAITVTETQATSGGYVTAYADGVARPISSNVNFTAGATVANLVITSIGADGKVALYNGSSGTIQLLADVSGYYLTGTPQTAGAFGKVNTSRLLDTRTGRGVATGAGAVKPDSVVHLGVSGLDGVPTSNVAAVVLTVTVTSPTSSGYVTVFRDNTKRPTSSNLNFAARQTVANLVVARVGSDGKVALYNGSAGSTQMIADVSGYYLDGRATTAGTLALLGPSRLLDTRYGTGAPKAAVAAGGTVHLAVANQQGVPATGVSAVVLTLTVNGPTRGGYLTAYADRAPRPNVSNLNFLAGTTIANTVIVPVGANGAVSLYNGSSGTTELIADVAGYVTRSNTVWAQPSLPDPFQDGFSSVSCAAGFCAAGGAGGVIYTESNGTWTGPTVLGIKGNTVDSLSCVSASFCAGAFQSPGNKAQPVTYNGTTWTKYPAITNGIGAISCVSATFCVGLTGAGTGQYFTWDGNVWSGSTAAATVLGQALSCPSSTQCFSVRQKTYVKYDGATWVAGSQIDSLANLVSISCPSTTFCVAVDAAGNYVSYNGTTWSTPAATGAGAFTSRTSVSCSSSSFCAAVSASGSAVEFDGTTWGAPSSIDTNSVSAISCPSDGSCTAVDAGGNAVTYTGGSWGNPVSVDPLLGTPSAISCASTQSCVAVDNSGGYFRYTSTGWQHANAIDPAATDEAAVACPTTTFCEAVGSGGQSFTFNGTSWSSPIPVSADQLTSVSCVSSTSCVAVDGASGSAYRFDGSAWTADAGVDTAALTAVSCTSTLCVAVDNLGGEVTSSDAGVTWAAQVAIGTSPFAQVSCAKTTFCMAIDNGGTAYAYDGTSWTETSGGLGTTNGLSCTTDGTCVAIGSVSSLSYDGHSWGQPTPVTGALNLLSGVSCLPGLCAAVDTSGHGFIGR